jgi:hypothetical protein
MRLVEWLGARLILRGIAILAPVVAVGLTAGRLVAPPGQVPHDLSTVRAAPAQLIVGGPLQESASPGPATTHAPVLDAAAVAAAEGVAKAFLVGYASYRYDDGPDALRDRLRPYDTDAFDARLAQGGGAGVGGQERERRHEVARAAVENVNSEGLAANGRLVMVGLVSQAITSDQGAASRSRYVELFLTHTAKGWRVDEVMT